MRIREIRERYGFTQQFLAERLGTTQQTVARWESGKTQMTVAQLKDVAVALECTVDEVLGWEAEPHKRDSTFAATRETEMPFGALNVETMAGVHSYPISDKARDVLAEQLTQLSGPSGNGESRSGWVRAWSLDNRLLFINVRNTREIGIVSDDAEAMPDFENPEIYRELDEWPNLRADGRVRERCQEIVESVGEEQASRLVSQVRIERADGSEVWALVDEDSANQYAELETMTDMIMEPGLIKIDHEGGYYMRYVNLSEVSVVEVPLDRWLRMLEEEE